MAEHGSSNDRINNLQRRELAKLAVAVLDKKIQRARDESGDLVAQIRMDIREELGIEAIDNQIQAMEKQIVLLKKKKEEIGFSQYRDELLPGSRAKMLVEQRASAACENVRELEETKTEVISGIWASSKLSQALSILESVRKL